MMHTRTAELQVPLQSLNVLHILQKHHMMQLLHLNLGSNKLVGSLPDTWSRLSSVSPLDGASAMVHATTVM